MKWSISSHRPPHLYIDSVWYFIVASIVENTQILARDQYLTLWKDKLHELTSEFNWKLAAWVVLPHHYHILSLPKAGHEIGSFIKRLHGSTSYQLNLLDDMRGRTVWYSYWDTFIRGERDFWTRFNYIHYNPVKHGYVQKPEDWKFSSYRFYLQEEGEEWLTRCWVEFSAPDSIENDQY